MMQKANLKLTLLDIDGTLFDTRNYRNDLLDNVWLLIQKFDTDFNKEKLLILYKKIFDENQYFDPGFFIKRLKEEFINLSNEDLKKAVFMDDKLDSYIFSEVLSFLSDLRAISKIGILSKGDTKFQRLKIRSLAYLLDKDSFYIGVDKVDLLEEARIKNFGSEILIIDNKLSILAALNQIDSDIIYIWIRRSPEGDLDKDIDLNYNYTPNFKVSDLKQAIEIIKNVK